MNKTIDRLIFRIRPDLMSMRGQQRMSGIADVLTLLYTFPLAVIGFIWLVKASDWESIPRQWSLYLLMAVILYIFNRLRFFFITEIRTGGYANSDGTMDGIAVWVSVLLLGPTALWLKFIGDLLMFASSIYRERSMRSYWNRGRIFAADVSSDLLATLVALAVYRWVGGSIPISDYSISSILPALLAIVVQYIGTGLVYSGYIIYVMWSLTHVLHTASQPAISFFLMALSLPALANPFGILAAGIYAQHGFWEFIYIILGLILVAILARQLSRAVEYSRQQSRQIEQLEKLGRAILDAEPDGSDLAIILKKHVPSMFSSRGILIWTEANGILVQEPATASFSYEQAWKWLQVKKEAVILMPGDKLSWNSSIQVSVPLILCPILDVESAQLIGEIIMELQVLTIPWDDRAVKRLLPAVQSLAAQVASAIHQSNDYAKTLAMQKTLQELTLARSIQVSFLPETIPQIPGWQLAATLEPARQIAGDFYDFIHLPEGKLAILIADVADKGMGSALYMALSGTLIRTFANQHHQEPALVMKTVNQHILRNARANLFVTVFFSVLDPATGILRYANAGHNPPFLLSTGNGIRTLDNTGMPLGIDAENEWGQREIVISPGELLVLYTDGVMDAQNNIGEFIDRKMVISTFQHYVGKSAQEVQSGILNRIHTFVGDAPRFDDLTLVIVGRDDIKK